MSREILKPTGKEIKKALIDLDLGYMELAMAMGCSVYYIREITAETRKAREMRHKIACYLGSEMRKKGITHKWTQMKSSQMSTNKKEKVA